MIVTEHCDGILYVFMWDHPYVIYGFVCPLQQDHRFSDEIDKLTGYKTQSILCMAICNSDGEVIGVVQAINKNPMGSPFTEDDEKVKYSYVTLLKKVICLIHAAGGIHIHMHSTGYLSSSV